MEKPPALGEEQLIQGEEKRWNRLTPAERSAKVYDDFITMQKLAAEHGLEDQLQDVTVTGRDYLACLYVSAEGKNNDRLWDIFLLMGRKAILKYGKSPETIEVDAINNRLYNFIGLALYSVYNLPSPEAREDNPSINSS